MGNKGALIGSLNIDVDDNYLVAKLIFTPDEENGEEWDAEKVKRLLVERSITYGYTLEGIEEALTVISKSKEFPASVQVAKGDPPVEPRIEEIQWCEWPIPEDFIQSAERVLKKAPEPEIFEIKIEKIKVDKIVEKKSPLPFLPVKKEKVTVTEKKQIKIPIEIEPEVIKTGWIEVDGKIADIAPTETGQLGKSVLNRPIPPSPPPPLTYYSGTGVERKRTEFVATMSGFIRIGKNWLDIIPFKEHEWEVYLSEDKGSCYINFYTGEKYAREPSAEEILTAVDELGYPRENVISPENLEKLIHMTVLRGDSLDAYPIINDSDASIDIEVSSDKVFAWLNLMKGKGNGNPLIMKEVGARIKQSKLQGLDFEKIKVDLLAFYKSEQIELKRYVLVQGTPPTRGDDKRIELEIETQEGDTGESRDLLLKNTEVNGTPKSIYEFPLDDVKKVAIVKKGETLARFVADVAGADGVDIYGQVIPGIPGNDPPVKLFENVRLTQDAVLSEIDGILEVGQSADTTLFRMRPYNDSHIEIDVSEDKMKAFISAYPAIGGGISLSREAVLKIIEDEGIVHGVDDDVIEDVVSRLENGDETTHSIFARGVRPISESAGKVEFRVNFTREKIVTKKIEGQANEQVKYKVTIVNENAILAEVVHSVGEEQVGVDVYGEEVVAEVDAGEQHLIAGKHVIETRNKEGVLQYVSEIGGELLFDGTNLLIKNIHLVKGDVGPRTGNIKFSGSVKVEGAIISGFQLISGGDIIVEDVVNASLLSADGRVFVKGGIKGGGKAVLRAKKEIAVGFSEQARLLAVGDIRITNACQNSFVKCNGRLVLSSERGSLVGGEIKTKKGIEAQNIGTERGVKTAISFGQDYLIMDQIETEEREIDKIKDAVNHLNKIMKKVERMENNKKQLEVVRQKKLNFLKLMEKRSLRLFNLREKYEEHFPSTIVVRGKIFPGVVIESHGRYHEIEEVKSSIILEFDLKTGRISEKPLES